MTPLPAAAPSRWLLVLTICVVAAFTVLRLVTAASLDLRSDEAYYWTWSQQWVLSYLDQPPMVAWFERLGQLVAGDSALGARLAQIVALPAIEFLLADIARRRTGNWNAALFMVIAIECALDYAIFVIVIEPSVPMLLFVTTMFWCLVRLDETKDPRWWLAIGVSAGLALLSKYIALLFAPALLVFLFIESRHRKWLATPWPYVAASLALLLFMPVLIWNAQHEWASFAFQSVRLGAGHELGLGNLWRFGLYEAINVGPILLLATIAGAIALAVRAVRDRRGADAAVAAAFLVPFLVFLVRSLTLQVNQSWPYAIWPFGILALALALPWRTGWRLAKAAIAVVAITGLPVVGAMFFHAVADRGVWLGKGDPYGQDAGFGEMAEAVLARARQTGAKWIATTEYRTYANLLWHLRDEIPIVQVNERARFLDFTPLDPARLQGRALYVHQAVPAALLDAATLGPPEKLVVSWREAPMRTISLQTLDGFVPDLNPPPGSPAYIWN